MKIYKNIKIFILEKRISRINKKIVAMKCERERRERVRKEALWELNRKGFNLREKTPESKFVWKFISRLNYLEITIPYLNRISHNLRSRLQSLY